MTTKNIALNIIANAQGFQKEIAKIPGYTDKSAATAAMKLSTQMEKGFKKTEKQAKKSGSKIGGVLTVAAGNMLANLGTMAVSSIARLPAVFVELTTEAADFTNKINDMSLAVGMSSETLLGLDLLARASGGTLEKMQSALGGFAKKMTDAAKGTGEAKDAFKNLNIELKNADGSIREANDVFVETADKLAGMEDATTRASTAYEVFGRKGGDIIVAMNAMGMSLSEATKMMSAFGLGTEAASETAADFQRMKAVMESFSMGMKVQFMQVVIPVLLEFSSQIITAGRTTAEFFHNFVLGSYMLIKLAGTMKKAFDPLAEPGQDLADAYLNAQKISGAFYASLDAADAGLSSASDRIKELADEIQGMGSSGGLVPALNEGKKAAKGFMTVLEDTAEDLAARGFVVPWAEALMELSEPGAMEAWSEGVSSSMDGAIESTERLRQALQDLLMEKMENTLAVGNAITGAMTAGFEAEIEGITNVANHRQKKIDQRKKQIDSLKKTQAGASASERANIQSEIDALAGKNRRIRKQQRERQKDIRRLWKGQQAANISSAIMNQSVAIAKAWATLGPVGGPVASIALATTLGFEIKRIRQQKAPTFHAGFFGGGAPDESPAVLRRGESVLTQGASNAIGRDGVEALNQGRGSSSTFNFHIGGRLVESLVVDALGGGAAQRTLRPGGIAVGMVNPYVGR
tara:strand:+ start:2451 stop:4523 length:2073 start_codon:yes stop_codon:yes gene_type:complete